MQVKFGLSVKHTKFEKNRPYGFDNQLIYLVNVKTIRTIFSNYVCFSKSPNFTCQLENSKRVTTFTIAG